MDRFPLTSITILPPAFSRTSVSDFISRFHVEEINADLEKEI